MYVNTSPSIKLSNVYEHLATLGEGDSVTHQPFTTHLSHLGEVLNDLRHSARVLNEVNGALIMVLHLLEAAHAENLSADNLHCLISPVQVKLARSLNELDRTL